MPFLFHFTSETSLNASSALGCLFLSGWSCNAATNLNPNTNQVIRRESNLRRWVNYVLTQLAIVSTDHIHLCILIDLHPKLLFKLNQLDQSKWSVVVDILWGWDTSRQTPAFRRHFVDEHKRRMRPQRSKSPPQDVLLNPVLLLLSPWILSIGKEKRNTQRQKFEILSSCQLNTKCLLNRSKLERGRGRRYRWDGHVASSGWTTSG